MPKRLPDVVLVSPAIAQNTGAIARTCAGLGNRLHLIEPLGFELSDRGLKRSGLDYWPYALMCVHQSFEDFLRLQQARLDQLLLLSTKGRRLLTDPELSLEPIRYLVFGREDQGFPKQWYERYQDSLVQIPINFQAIRSHNLAVSVGLALGICLGSVRVMQQNQLGGDNLMA